MKQFDKKQFKIFISIHLSIHNGKSFQHDSLFNGNKKYTCQEENLITQGHLDHLLGTWMGETQTLFKELSQCYYIHEIFFVKSQENASDVRLVKSKCLMVVQHINHTVPI